MLDQEQWRLGHRRPWWQWNVITLCVALFALVWARELWDLDKEATIGLCFAIVVVWLIVPTFKQLAAYQRRVARKIRAIQPGRTAKKWATQFRESLVRMRRAFIDDDEWRLGHWRPWWQWNVITLCVVLFALVWMRELFGMGYVGTWILSLVVFLAWLVIPVWERMHHDLMLANRAAQVSANAGDPFPESRVSRFRTIVVIVIALVCIAAQVLALLS
jgi:hypothetical protein